jgi:hypothetical protein
MACSTAPVSVGAEDTEQIDAAIPFLSFAAGLMTVAEIMKLSLPSYPFTTNRVILNTYSSPRLVRLCVPSRDGCICRERNGNVHRKMLAGGRYTRLMPALEAA